MLININFSRKEEDFHIDERYEYGIAPLVHASCGHSGLSGVFAGTSEFIIVGVLPDIARSQHCRDLWQGNSQAIFQCSCATTPIGAAICSEIPATCAPIALASHFLPAMWICTFAVNYPMLLLARVVTARFGRVFVAMALASTGRHES